MKSISSLTFYVQDLEATAAFYEALGFRFGTHDDTQLVVYLNWFSMKFLPQAQEEHSEFIKEANLFNKGAGMYVNIKVDNVDEFYDAVVSKGMKPSSKPRDWPWGNREFALRDPDGYKLVFFQNGKQKLSA